MILGNKASFSCVQLVCLRDTVMDVVKCSYASTWLQILQSSLADNCSFVN